MNILVVGSGGREHAICSSFRNSPRSERVFCADGNAGISSVAERVPIRPDDIESLLRFSLENAVDITFVGGETPLASGIVDAFLAAGLRIIGPTQAAARLETSKAFAKDFMVRHNVPTAEYAVANSAAVARQVLESGRFGGHNAPVVVKADGLAGGKGVVVARDRSEGLLAVNELASAAGPAAGQRILLEECLTGKEVSLLLFADGENYVLMPPARDHKRIFEGDRGPNTGGMGAITDETLLTAGEINDIERTIIGPTLRGCVEEGFPYRGVLFLGLMMTREGPRVLEYNVRFGDPETQAILVRLETDFVDLSEALLESRLSSSVVKWRAGNSACVVLAAAGYPAAARTGDLITGIQDAETVPGVSVFHAGTARESDERLVTAGGRVLGVTAVGSDLDEVLARAYSATSKISFDGMQIRRDIGK